MTGASAPPTTPWSRSHDSRAPRPGAQRMAHSPRAAREPERSRWSPTAATGALMGTHHVLKVEVSLAPYLHRESSATDPEADPDLAPVVREQFRVLGAGPAPAI